MLRLAVPDMVSSSFFPVLAAVDLGFLHDEGVDASLELLPPPSKLFAALREGELDFADGGASDTLSAFPGCGERSCLRPCASTCLLSS